jgi:hypothetical protein
VSDRQPSRSPLRPKTRRSQLSANRRYQQKRQQAGMIKKTVWLKASARADLELLKSAYDTYEAALEAALRIAATRLESIE